jgi:hypothetical protein
VTNASVSSEPVGDRLVLCLVSSTDSMVASSRARGAFLNLGERLSSERLPIRCVLLTVDIEEYREWVVDCREDVKEEELLLLSENLCFGDAGVWFSRRLDPSY